MLINDLVKEVRAERGRQLKKYGPIKGACLTVFMQEKVYGELKAASMKGKILHSLLEFADKQTVLGHDVLRVSDEMEDHWVIHVPEHRR